MRRRRAVAHQPTSPLRQEEADEAEGERQPEERVDHLTSPSSALDQEVEGEAGEADERGGARRCGRSRSGRRGRRRRRRRPSPRVPLTSPSTTKRSKTRLAKRPIASAGRTTRMSISLVEVPLVVEEGVDAGRSARSACRGISGPQRRRPSRRSRSRRREIAAPIARPNQEAPVEGWIAASGESAKTGSRKWVTVSSTPGTWTKPANSARKASTPIAIFIGGDCSAMWWSAPGKPTSVVLLFAGRRVARRLVGEVAGVDQLLRLLARLAGQDPEDRGGRCRRRSAARRSSRGTVKIRYMPPRSVA